MKFFQFFLNLSLLVSAWGQEGKLDELDPKVRTLLSSDSLGGQDLSWITEETRPGLIAKLLEIRDAERKESTLPNAGFGTEGKLVALGHIETIERWVAAMNVPGGDSPLEKNGTETAIPYLMPMVYTASTERPPIVSDIINPPVQCRYALCVTAIIARSEVFAPATREWAKHMHGNLFSTKVRERTNLLKQWWEHNQSALVEGRYADAVWLPRPYKGKASYFSDEEARELKAAQKQPRPVRRGPHEETPATTTREESFPRTFWICSAALILLAAILFNVMHRGVGQRRS